MRPRDEQELQAVTDLAAGRLSPLVAWRLRRRIARRPDLAKALADTEALFADLRGLAVEATDRPPLLWPNAGIRPRRSFLGGIPMNRPVAVAATAALCLLGVTGGVAAVRYFSDPFDSLEAGNGLTWHADLSFRGEVRFYSPNGQFRGSVSRAEKSGSGSSEAPSTAAVATVIVGDETFVVQGTGPHPLRSRRTEENIGTVVLVPETAAQREAARRAHDQSLGIEEPLSISHGARDGFGQCIGFFGDNQTRVPWKLMGENVVVAFINPVTGKQVYSGTAFAVNDAVRAEQRAPLSQEAYRATVADSVPPQPRFLWTDTVGIEHRVDGYTTSSLTLPDGRKLRVVLRPYTRR